MNVKKKNIAVTKNSREKDKKAPLYSAIKLFSVLSF